MPPLLETPHAVFSPSSQPEAGPSHAPIESFQRRQDILDVPTELLIQTFDDRILVIVTQNGKVGCLIQASLPPVVPLPLPSRPNGAVRAQPGGVSGAAQSASTATAILASLPPPAAGTNLLPLLGAPPNQALYELYASQLATLVWWSLQEKGARRRPVVLGLALNRLGRGADTEADGGGGAGDGDADEDEAALSELERERFAAICGMIGEWDGPSS